MTASRRFGSAAITVTAALAVLPPMLALIVAVPADTALTTPLETVATTPLLVLQVAVLSAIAAPVALKAE